MLRTTIKVKSHTLAIYYKLKFIVFDIMGFFHCLKELMNFYEAIIENLEFPCEIKKKLKMKVSMGNLKPQFINGYLIKFDKTNLSVQEPYKIIASNKKNTFMALLYDNRNKYIYLVIMQLYLSQNI